MQNADNLTYVLSQQTDDTCQWDGRPERADEGERTCSNRPSESCENGENPVFFYHLLGVNLKAAFWGGAALWRPWRFSIQFICT